MFVMTTKIDKKKIAIVAAAVIAVIAAAMLLFGGSDSAATAAPSTVASNDDRVKFLESFGWEVVTSPTETSQVRIPAQSNEIFDRYNALQKSQGYDLSQYAGKTVMRYVYKINNFPGATEPVYATILVYKNQIIGGDVTNTAPKGVIQGFQKQGATPSETVPAETTPATEPAPTQ